MAELLSFPKDVHTDLQTWSVSYAILKTFPSRLSLESELLLWTIQTVWMCGYSCFWILDSLQHLGNTFKSLQVAQLHCLKHWVVICLLEDPFRMCSAPWCRFPGSQGKERFGGVPGKSLGGDCSSRFYPLREVTDWEGNWESHWWLVFME